jgi:hypothetical protein
MNKTSAVAGVAALVTALIGRASHRRRRRRQIAFMPSGDTAAPFGRAMRRARRAADPRFTAGPLTAPASDASGSD